jgi:hypothetical protein
MEVQEVMAQAQERHILMGRDSRLVVVATPKEI